MLFNSLIFILFFVVVYSLYLVLGKRYKAQNRLLLVASYIFYGYWDWRFLSLIAISTIIDFYVGRNLHATQDSARRKRFLLLSIVANLTMLGFFKYFNFFAESLTGMLGLVGMEAGFVTLQIILPVGISFYTFQTMSYTIDIYRGKVEPTKSFLDFALFVSFFPQLVAGPIERAVNLLPQIMKPRNINLASVNSGIYLVLWGFFKKVVIADNVGIIANQIFDGYLQYQGLDILIGILAFTVQIYCDFSAYSDIARGISRLMGFELMVNFKLPYFALNPTDFWLRWHVSLSSWLRDYLYIPLGGSRGSSYRIQRNLLLTMLLGGLWHGAAWNYVIWGAFHGGILMLYRIFDRNPEHEDPWGGKYSYTRILAKMSLMFVLTLIGWVIFRATSTHQIFYMLTNTSFSLSADSLQLGYKLLFFSIPLVVMQICQYVKRDLLVMLRLRPIFIIGIYSFFLIWIFIFGVRESMEFIYFQF